jgi:hypothetical protein
MTRLILTSSAGSSLIQEDFADAVVYFISRFVWGQLPSPDELAAYLGARSDQPAPYDHWTVFGKWHDGGRDFENLGFVEFCRQCETIELWFDLSPNDQLLLVWLLDHFRSHPDVVARLRLRLVDFELNSIPPSGLGNRKVQDIGVSVAELETASGAWQAYRAPTPEACFALLASDLTALPLLRLALHHLLAELPSSTTGLGATEMRMLELLAWGFANANPLFYFRDLRGTYVFDEEEHGRLLDRLASGPVPAVAGLEELGTISREKLGACHKAIRRSRSLSLTEFGEAIVAHREDFSRHNPIDRWWGGTRLTNDRLWRWNPVLVAP